MNNLWKLTLFIFVLAVVAFLQVSAQSGRVLIDASARKANKIGQEVSVPTHLQDGEEYTIPLRDLIEHGKKLFKAVWTSQEGGGRPLTKGTGAPLTDSSNPLVFPRNFNRISGPEANSCAGCHNSPFGIAGGGGDIVANVFVLGQRFDFATFDASDRIPTRGSMDETFQDATQQSIANSRNTLGMFGSGYIEMLARQVTADLQAIRNSLTPGTEKTLVSKGISFGTLARNSAGLWITSGVRGLAAPSLVSSGPSDPPSLQIRPFHQAGNAVSLRHFTNSAFNHHHGIQSTERFGVNVDVDGDGFVNELTRADVTAVTVFQATMAVPGRLIPNDPEIEAAVLVGEDRFQKIGCGSCHIPSLPLDKNGWIYTEPNPYNPPEDLRVGQAPTLQIDLSSDELPSPRLKPVSGVVQVPAFTDLKLHDITSGPGDPNVEPLDMNQPAGLLGFFANRKFFFGNSKFITRKLWGTANEPPFFHHGQYTTIRESVLAHSGEALASRRAFQALPADEQDSVIEFLKTLEVLPPGTNALIVDENGKEKIWPPRR
ncbi:MAG TPA: di-heme oxidoredictase family protein [Acidobacteriota bacterium]|jgi:cytochrome c peroxidase